MSSGPRLADLIDCIALINSHNIFNLIEISSYSGATWSSRCSSAASGRGKRSPQLAVRLLRGKRLKRTVRRAPPAPPPRLGDRVVVETLHTTSRANVVWQVRRTLCSRHQIYCAHKVTKYFSTISNVNKFHTLQVTIQI